jgi:hypothetical protein
MLAHDPLKNTVKHLRRFGYLRAGIGNNEVDSMLEMERVETDNQHI